MAENHVDVHHDHSDASVHVDLAVDGGDGRRWKPIGHVDVAAVELRRVRAPHVDGELGGSGTEDALKLHVDLGHVDVGGHFDIGHFDFGHVDMGHLDVGHFDVFHIDVHVDVHTDITTPRTPEGDGTPDRVRAMMQQVEAVVHARELQLARAMEQEIARVNNEAARTIRQLQAHIEALHKRLPRGGDAD